MKYLLILGLLATPVHAQTCPPQPDISAEADALLAEVQAATDERAARVIGRQLWALWATAPDEKAQALLDYGMSRRESYDFEGAHAAFEELVDYCPHYAEGYNQRAFVAFLQGQYGAALDDLDRALELRPRHVAALSGKALTLMGLGRMAAAQGVLREALALNPWIPERGLLQPLEPAGTEL